jgi:large subunit ribosomal protein L23
MAALKIFGKDKKEKSALLADAPKRRKEKDAPKEALVAQETNGEKKKVIAQTGLYIIRPHITEKATDLAAKNQYVFVVENKSSKKEIEKSAEKMYGVEVVGVRIVNVRAKKMRLGKRKGMKKGYKKAIVQVKQGQSIEILPA